MNVLINITYRGQSGNYLVNLDPGLDDKTIKNICEEAVRAGEVPGIDPHIPHNAFDNFVIDRFNTDPVRFVVRPKVPFGRIKAGRGVLADKVGRGVGGRTLVPEPSWSRIL